MECAAFRGPMRAPGVWLPTVIAQVMANAGVRWYGLQILDSLVRDVHNIEKTPVSELLPHRVSSPFASPMPEILQTSVAQLVLMVTILLIMIAAAVYVLGRYRDRAGEDQLSAHDALTNFRELHSQGDLSEAEFRTIRTVLAAKLQDEIKDTGESA